MCCVVHKPLNVSAVRFWVNYEFSCVTLGQQHQAPRAGFIGRAFLFRACAAAPAAPSLGPRELGRGWLPFICDIIFQKCQEVPYQVLPFWKAQSLSSSWVVCISQLNTRWWYLRVGKPWNLILSPRSNLLCSPHQAVSCGCSLVRVCEAQSRGCLLSCIKTYLLKLLFFKYFCHPALIFLLLPIFRLSSSFFRSCQPCINSYK